MMNSVILAGAVSLFQVSDCPQPFYQPIYQQPKVIRPRPAISEDGVQVWPPLPKAPNLDGYQPMPKMANETELKIEEVLKELKSISADLKRIHEQSQATRLNMKRPSEIEDEPKKLVAPK
jgi:predicted mannosyl-3-phosphoglycerate phosphatase (HAD superfamily)